MSREKPDTIAIVLVAVPDLIVLASYLPVTGAIFFTSLALEAGAGWEVATVLALAVAYIPVTLCLAIAAWVLLFRGKRTAALVTTAALIALPALGCVGWMVLNFVMTGM